MSAKRNFRLEREDVDSWVVFEKRFDDQALASMKKWLESAESGGRGEYDYWVSMGMGHTSETCFVFSDLATGTLFKLRFG